MFLLFFFFFFFSWSRKGQVGGKDYAQQMRNSQALQVVNPKEDHAWFSAS